MITFIGILISIYTLWSVIFLGLFHREPGIDRDVDVNSFVWANSNIRQIIFLTIIMGPVWWVVHFFVFVWWCVKYFYRELGDEASERRKEKKKSREKETFEKACKRADQLLNEIDRLMKENEEMKKKRAK